MSRISPFAFVGRSRGRLCWPPMRNTSVYLNVGLACTVASAATVYKWVDENGVTHFSDQPHENAQKVELKAPQTFTAPKTRRRFTPTPPNGAGAKVYQTCGMSEPTNDQVFLNTDTVSAGTSVSAGRSAWRYRARDDGRCAGSGSAGQWRPIYDFTGGSGRAHHSDGGEGSFRHDLCSSPSVTFHVRQPSLQSPTNPIRKH